jgi:cytochrome c553
MLGKMIAATSEESLYEPLRMTTNYLSHIPEEDMLLLGENVTVSLCGHCHRPDFNGGPAYIPDSPPVPSLKASAAWSLADFQMAIQMGVRPSGANMDPAHMPWKAFQNMTDKEAVAVHDYLKKQF